MKKGILFLIAILVMTLSLTACGDAKENGRNRDKERDNLVEEIENAMDNESDNQDDETDGSEIEQETSDEIGEGISDIKEAQRWPDGYRDIPEFKAGKSIYLSDGTNNFVVIYQKVSRDDLDEYCEVLEEEGYILDYINDDGSFSYTKRDDAAKLYCNVSILYDSEEKQASLSGIGKK